MSKYRLELRCSGGCGNKRDISDEEIKNSRNPKTGVLEFPICCYRKMRLHSYRPTRYQFCNDARCVYADGGNCACTCEATFHGIEAGIRTKARYIYA